MCPLDVCMGKAMIYLVKAYLEPIQWIHFP
jgi:hypothetical protein